MAWTHNEHLAPESSHCLRALAWGYGAHACSGMSLRAQSNGNPTQPKCSQPGCAMGCWMRPQCGMTCERLAATNGEDESTCSAPGFRANRSPSRARSAPEMTRATDGRTLPGSSARYDRQSCGWKTSQGSLLDLMGTSGASSVTWSRWGMMLCGRSYLLSKPELHTGEIGGGALASVPTPTATDSRGSRNATCRRQPGAVFNSGMTLTDFVTMWPTPTAHNAKEGGYPSEGQRNTPTLAWEVGGKLNPQFVEWLMGVPIGWTDCEPLEMAKSPHNSFWHGITCGAKPEHGG